jgi:hypothetical protein
MRIDFVPANGDRDGGHLAQVRLPVAHASGSWLIL